MTVVSKKSWLHNGNHVLGNFNLIWDLSPRLTTIFRGVEYWLNTESSV